MIALALVLNVTALRLTFNNTAVVKPAATDLPQETVISAPKETGVCIFMKIKKYYNQYSDIILKLQRHIDTDTRESKNIYRLCNIIDIKSNKYW